jgi:hypothetical protein
MLVSDLALALDPESLREEHLDLCGPVDVASAKQRVPRCGKPFRVAAAGVVADRDRAPVEKVGALGIILRPEP